MEGGLCRPVLATSTARININGMIEISKSTDSIDLDYGLSTISAVIVCILLLLSAGASVLLSVRDVTTMKPEDIFSSH